jgi:hypothetical protein
MLQVNKQPLPFIKALFIFNSRTPKLSVFNGNARIFLTPDSKQRATKKERPEAIASGL